MLLSTLYFAMAARLLPRFSARLLQTSAAPKKLRPFDELPSPPTVPFLGHSYLFFPGGKYNAERLTEAVLDLSESLGPTFKLKLGGTTLLVTIDADHTERMFRNEGRLPIRPPFPALVKYRKEAFSSIGIVPGNGKEWHKFRNGVLPLLKRNVVESYKGRHEHIASMFVEYIKRNTDDDQILHDLFSHLLNYTIDAISVVSPGRCFDCLSGEKDEARRLTKASIDFMNGLYSTLLGPPLWKLYKTEGYRKLESSHHTIYSCVKHYLNELRTLCNNNPSLLQQTNPYMFLLLDNKNLLWEDMVMLAMEILLGGIDATATTAALALHYLSHNPEVQSIARAAASDDGNHPFLYACVKETLRLSPTAGANSRFMVHGTQIGDYAVPSGTLVLAFGSVTSRSERYFKEPLRFYPQRWLRGSKEDVHPFASLPFGYGPRMCPGKRLAEQEIVILLKKVLLSFEMLPVGCKEIGMVYRMNRIPDRPINIKFVSKYS